MIASATPPARVPLVSIDTSVWVSSVLPNDSNHIVARNWIGKHTNNGGSFVAPMLIVVETAATIARVTGRKKAAPNAVSRLYSLGLMRLVPMDQTLVDEAIDMAILFKLRGSDSLFVAVARLLGIPLVTFDREQLTRPARAITTIKP